MCIFAFITHCHVVFVHFSYVFAIFLVSVISKYRLFYNLSWTLIQISAELHNLPAPLSTIACKSFNKLNVFHKNGQKICLLRVEPIRQITREPFNNSRAGQQPIRCGDVAHQYPKPKINDLGLSLQWSSVNTINNF